MKKRLCSFHKNCESKEFTSTSHPPNARVCGYASVFDIVDQQNECVQKGAFVDTLIYFQQQKVTLPMLFQHDTTDPIGLWDVLEEDDHGLWVEGECDKAHPLYAKVRSLLACGGVQGLSIGFDIKRSHIQNGVKIIEKVDLVEVSLVTHPANPLTGVQSLGRLDTNTHFI